MDLEPPLQVPLQQVLNATASPVHHILAGSFRSLSLFLLAFSPAQLTLDLVQTIPAFGPHQYIGLGPSTKGVDVRHAYTTSWALPPQLQSWAIEQQPDGLRVRFVDSVDITATSSYITVPPPYSHIYSAGGPSAQSEWDAADKTRKALRYGSHGVEFAFPTGSSALAFIPVLGGSMIEVYKRAEDGSLIHVDSSPAPQRAGGVPEEEDGPRHVKVHPNGRVLYCVTEHSNYLDVYTITPPSGSSPVLTYVASRSLIPPHLRTDGVANATDGVKRTYRGDTLLLAPSTPAQPAPQSIFVTTRGGEGETTHGWVSVFRLDAEGMFAGDIEANPYLVERYEAKTSGGKAHALDLRAKSEEDPDGALWVILTDDSPPHPGVRVLEWDGWLWRGGGTRLREVTAWPRPGFYESDTAKEGEPEQMAGASHAVWLD
ncbi:Muconate cycloisomerase 1 [Mycena venus]|uniref:Muconate cycloisomerase 1 n=1 Tax=Mycena venus TaxID=2733690 RepID=A0A8H6Z194_9AGAR|nr:Muconate cycloisomerase 1 [Mycena venus]